MQLGRPGKGARPRKMSSQEFPDRSFLPFQLTFPGALQDPVDSVRLQALANAREVFARDKG